MPEKINILVVSADARTPNFLSDLLQENGFHLIVALSVEEGISTFRSRGADVVLLCENFPGNEPVEFIDKIKEIDPFQQCILIGDKNSEKIAYFLNNGFFDFIDRNLPIALITHRVKQAYEMKKAQSNCRMWMEGILDSIGDGLAIIDSNYKIVKANKNFARVIDRGDDLEGQYCYKLLHKFSKPCSQCPITKTLKTGQLATDCEYIWTKLGLEKVINLSTLPIKTDHGKIKQVVAIFKDASENEILYKDLAQTKHNLELLNKKLEEKLNYFSILLSISDKLQFADNLDGILSIITKAVISEDGLNLDRVSILLINDDGYLEKQYELQDSRDIGSIQVFDELQISLNDTEHQFMKCLYEEKARILRSSLCPDQTELFALLDTDEICVVPLVVEKQIYGVILADNALRHVKITEDKFGLLQILANYTASAVDRTILKHKLEGKIKELEEAYDSLRYNQAKLIRIQRLTTIGELAAQIAHELKNPLVAIGGFANSILKDIDPEHKTYEKAKIIAEEVQSLERITSTILNYSKLSKPKFEELDISKVISLTLKIVEGIIKPRNIRIINEISEGFDTILGDKEQIHQVFLNLIMNAISAMPDGGELAFKGFQDSNYLNIEIRDTGTGISDDLADKVFQPFFTTKSTGTGLGLAIVSDIIETHNGKISFVSNPNKGTTFFVKLPIKKMKYLS
ncbi:PAS domain-containing protein [bacterium]|nr:PAS domain-containing protein [bacterium]